MTAAFLLLLFGAVTTWLSLQIRVGTLRAPGSGFFPFYLGLLLVLLAAIHLGRLWRSGATRPGREAFVKNAQDMTVNLAYVGPVEFGKMMAADHDRYAKLVQGVKK